MREEIYHDDYITVIVTDEKGAGGAHHTYEILNRETGDVLNTVSFQKGPIADNGVNGSTNEAYLAIVGHRLECFQSGPFPSHWSVKAQHGVDFARSALEMRTAERKARGVEGKDIA
ncbi:MAG: hypothetical protein OXI63_01775 [Candidatus Poribacteria bacterium]|nr:hypothetical protein [Candidatus Poribacteria bacterium]